MVRAAIADQPGFAVDDREVRRDGPSYMVLTLRELRAEAPARPLCLVVGMDAFLGLPQWYEWREVLELAHVVVAHRPGWSAPADGPLGELLAARAARSGSPTCTTTWPVASTCGRSRSWRFPRPSCAT